MQNTTRSIAALAGMALLLAGCGKGVTTGNAATAATGEATPAGAGADAQVGAKVSAYTEAHNKLIDTFGLTETARRYMDERIAAKSPSDSISISDGWIEQALAKFKEARAMPGDTPALDRAGDALIAALDKVMARLVPLNTYYDGKAYKDDGLARGRREDPLMVAEFRAALAEADRFDQALSGARRARLDVELARLKEAGNVLGYNSKLELKQAEDLLALFPDPAAVRDAARYARADALVASLEKLLAEQRAAYAAAKARAAPTDQPDYGHSSVVDSLTSMIGDYREMRQSKDPSDFEDLVKEYNRAVESANRID